MSDFTKAELKSPLREEERDRERENKRERSFYFTVSGVGYVSRGISISGPPYCCNVWEKVT